MAGVRGKIVRLENVPITGNVHFKDTEGSGKELDLSYGFPREDEDDDIRLGESAIDEGDVVFPLPDDWPKIPQLFVRRSWDLSTATSPAVNKAVAHLELLQTAMEDWSREVEVDVMSRASSHMKSRAASSASLLGPPQDITLGHSGLGSHTSRRLLRFTSPSARTSAKSGMSRTTKSSGLTQLSIEGFGAKMPEIDRESVSEVDEIVLDIPYLGAEEVVDEVITLLARLENDRRQARVSLQREQDRIAMLQGRIDGLAQHRMEEFAESVQNEHEACSMDINELNWHVSYRSRIESRIKNKVAIAEVLNSRLKEDIEFVNKHCPLVQEKLELEREAMERIKRAQHDTNDELSVTVDRCAKVETKSEEAYTKADMERIHLQQEVEQVRAELANVSQELSEEKMLFNSYIHQCNDFRQQLEDNQQELMVLEVKHENAKTGEEMQAAKVRDFQAKIVEQEFEHGKHTDLNTRLDATLRTQRAANSAAEHERVTDINKKQTHLRNLTLTNDELDMDIEDAISTIEKCDKQRIADDKNLVRMEKEQVRTRDQMKVTDDDLAKVRSINNAISDKLEKVEENTAAQEETLKATCEQLRKQVKEEIHSRTVIMARISSDSNDLVKSHAEAKQKKEKQMGKKADEVEAQVQNVLAKVEKLRAANEERLKRCQLLKEQLQECVKLREILEEEHKETKNEVEPKHKQLTEDLEAARKKVEHMAWKTDMMRKNMDEMSASFKMMSKSITKTEDMCEKLRDEFDDLHSELTALQHIDEQLKSSIKTLTKRIQEAEMKHAKMKRERNAALVQHEADLVANIALNKDLASSYRRSQNEYLRVKNRLLNKYEERLKLENSVKDLKQIKSLQKRMHSSLLEYYKLRGAYNINELQRMEIESSQNASNVSGLKTEMDRALDSISYFLKTQMDGTSARKLAMEKVVYEETGQRVDLAISQGAPTIVTLKSSRANSGVTDSLSSHSKGSHITEVLGMPVIPGIRPPTGASIQVQ